MWRVLDIFMLLTLAINLPLCPLCLLWVSWTPCHVRTHTNTHTNYVRGYNVPPCCTKMRIYELKLLFVV